MASNDITVTILKEIRSDMRETRAELGELRAELRNFRDETNVRFDLVNRHIVESEIRTATAIVELAGTVHEMSVTFASQRELRTRVGRCERDIADLKRRRS